MPFSEFQPGNAGLALPQYQFQTGTQTLDQSASLMERAQKMRIANEQLDIAKQNLTSEMALRDQQVKESQKRIAQIDLAVKQGEVQTDSIAEKAKATANLYRELNSLTSSDNTAGTSQMKADIAGLENLPLNTMADFTNAQAQASAVVAKYAKYQVLPEGKALIDALMKPFEAKVGTAQAMLNGRSFSSAQKLLTPLMAVTDKAGLDAYVSKNKDDHDLAMLNPKYATLYEATAKDVRDKQAALSNSLELKKKEQEFQERQITQRRTINFPEAGISGVATSDEGADQLRKGVTSYIPAKRALTELQKVLSEVEKGGVAEKIVQTYYGSADAFHQKLVTAIGRLQVGGVLSDSEQKRMEKIVPNPSDLTSLNGRTRERLKALNQEIEDAMDAYSMAGGLTRQSAQQKPASGKTGSEIFGNLSPNGKQGSR